MIPVICTRGTTDLTTKLTTWEFSVKTQPDINIKWCTCREAHFSTGDEYLLLTFTQLPDNFIKNPIWKPVADAAGGDGETA